MLCGGCDRSQLESANLAESRSEEAVFVGRVSVCLFTNLERAFRFDDLLGYHLVYHGQTQMPQ